MSWNYRVVKHFEDDYYEIREVYYNEEGEINAYVSHSECMESEDLSWMIERFKEALEKPVLHLTLDNEIEELGKVI